MKGIIGFAIGTLFGAVGMSAALIITAGEYNGAWIIDGYGHRFIERDNTESDSDKVTEN